MEAYKVIDVSVWNGNIDWKKVKSSGVYGVIIRAGYGCVASQKDKAFERNYAGAIEAGLHVGAYWYSYAVTVDGSKTEAQVFLDAIKGKAFDLPIYLDMEEMSQVKMSKSACTVMAIAFCTVLETAGYWAGVYSFDSFFGRNLETSIQGRYSCWVACVENVQPRCCKSYSMWQYSWKGKVNGISGDVDCNHCYVNFPENIRKKKLNGCTDTYTITATKSGLCKAEVIVRKNRLEADGYTVKYSSQM